MITMKFEGGAELAKVFDSLSLRLGKKVLHEALREAAEPIRKAAQSFAPRGEEAPHIAQNIGIGNARPPDEPHAAAVKVGPVKGFAYGLPQELGTVHHAAHPFMRPAFDLKADEALRVLGEAAWRELAGKGISRPTASGGSVSESVAGGGRPGVEE
jgi:HK97 gp10 family phage protein